MRSSFFQTLLGRSLVLALSVTALGWYVVHAGCSRSSPEVVPAPAPAAPAQAAQPSSVPVAPAVDAGAGAPDAASPSQKRLLGPKKPNDPYFIPATKSAGIGF